MCTAELVYTDTGGGQGCVSAVGSGGCTRVGGCTLGPSAGFGHTGALAEPSQGVSQPGCTQGGSDPNPACGKSVTERGHVQRSGYGPHVS